MPTLELNPRVAQPTTDLRPAAPTSRPVREPAETVFDVADASVHYGSTPVLRSITMEIAARQITAIIGPSGCGKSTLLRCFNRMNDLVDGCRVEGTIRYRGTDLYGPDVDPVEVRRRIGMVFQKATPFPKSIFDNVAYGLRLTGRRRGLGDEVEQALRRAALWDEVKDRLKTAALGLSGGQQQRLCIARAIAVEPEVLLMDEPCSALDPIATARIEELLVELRKRFTILIVTHNMQQAARISDHTAFLAAELAPGDGSRAGVLVEHGPTKSLFTEPRHTRTRHYLEGRLG